MNRLSQLKIGGSSNGKTPTAAQQEPTNAESTATATDSLRPNAEAVRSFSDSGQVVIIEYVQL